MAFGAIGIAITATAAVELFKDLLPIRRRFQRNFLAAWFSQRLHARSKNVAHKELLDAEKDLVHLATGGDRDAFYDLEPPQLCGQMNSAAQIALAYPDRHHALLRFLAPEAKDEDIETIIAAAKMTKAQQESGDIGPALDARNRVTHHLQRSIDALQISMGFRWKFWVQVAIYSICFVASYVSVFAVKEGRYTCAEAFVMAVVAGFLSPVFSDLAAAVNRWRKP